jgi:DNA uptake protein ComE-like DNA-binding protein
LIPRSLLSPRLVSRVALVVALLCVAIVNLGARDDWTVLENCRLFLNPANDGDSFHVSAGKEEYIFRLYLVDAPETDGTEPRRLVEQAKYFEITVPQAIEVGLAAKVFTREKLSEPFTVLTRMSDAMGRSKLERFYAFVQTKDGDLGEQLVRNGLARSYGFKAVPPGLSRLRPERQKLQQLEDEARQEKIGGWGINDERLNVRAQKPSRFTVFVPGAKAAPRARPLANASEQIFSTPAANPSIAVAERPQVNDESDLGKIDINRVTEKELQTVPGIGPVMAARIIAARPFKSADDLKKVSGIGDKKYSQMRPYFK